MPAAVAIPLIVGAATAGATVYGAAKASGANKYAAQLQATTAQQAGDLEAKSAQDALAFARDQEARRQKEWQATQDLNYSIWGARQAGLAPYRDFGVRAIGQLARPIGNLAQRPTTYPPPPAGTLGSLAGA